MIGVAAVTTEQPNAADSQAPDSPKGKGGLWCRVRAFLMNELEDKDAATFKAMWDEATAEAREAKIKLLEHDFEERRGSLRAVSQDASATANVLALLLVGIGLVTQAKVGIAGNWLVRIAAWCIGGAIILLLRAYMPRFFKSWFSNFEGAGMWLGSIKSSFDYADRLRRDLNIRNRILQRARRQLSATMAIITVIVICLCLFISVS